MHSASQPASTAALLTLPQVQPSVVLRFKSEDVVRFNNEEPTPSLHVQQSAKRKIKSDTAAARRSLEASKKAKEEHFIYRTQLQPGGYIKTRILNRLARSDLLLAKVNIKQSKAGALITYKVPEIKAAVLEQWPKEWPTLTLPAEESQSDDTVEQAVEAAAE